MAGVENTLLIIFSSELRIITRMRVQFQRVYVVKDLDHADQRELSSY